ncbi:MAG: bifunctional folylpolyglutamate synthase/dihydrofolate synthase [Lachnospiraceae bacterium]|nr:bifunctional folylpolyglutamate synthase/dihydrofolate synthase [Lachnospiraceae bacterium]
MNYRQTMEYIESLSQYGSVLGLKNMERMCDALGQPQESLRIIHVAGTNGKGSTAAYLSSVLRAAGYRVGTYTSPAVDDYRERFCVNGRMISQRSLCEYMGRMKKVSERITAQGFPHPTVFEMETALAFLYFQEKNCDYVVLEVGMGGAEDATNIVRRPVACVWASISMDHMAMLGKTLGEIAAVKAGIAKPGAICVTTNQAPEVMAELSKAVERANACGQAVDVPSRGDSSGLILADSTQAKILGENLTTQQFRYREFTKCKIHLSGRHQIANAVLAIECIRQLRQRGADIPDQAVYEGLDQARWPGRMEVIGRHPVFVLDGAHNEDAARRLAQNIEIYFTNKRMIYIMGVLKDKEYEKILALTARYADHILTVTPPENPRALSALELAWAARKYHDRVTNTASLEEAVELSHLLAQKEDVILCFGSLSYLGKMRQAYREFQNRK